MKNKKIKTVFAGKFLSAYFMRGCGIHLTVWEGAEIEQLLCF